MVDGGAAEVLDAAVPDMAALGAKAGTLNTSWTSGIAEAVSRETDRSEFGTWPEDVVSRNTFLTITGTTEQLEDRSVSAPAKLRGRSWRCDTGRSTVEEAVDGGGVGRRRKARTTSAAARSKRKQWWARG